jgi:hypothetical protein
MESVLGNTVDVGGGRSPYTAGCQGCVVLLPLTAVRVVGSRKKMESSLSRISSVQRFPCDFVTSTFDCFMLYTFLHNNISHSTQFQGKDGNRCSWSYNERAKILFQHDVYYAAALLRVRRWLRWDLVEGSFNIVSMSFRLTSFTGCC